MKAKNLAISNDQYWCELENEEFLDAAAYKTSKYYDFLCSSGIHQLWKRSLIAYYGGDLNNETSIFESSKLTKDGKAGQISKAQVNSYRNLIVHALNLATANKNSLTCVAANTDYKSQAQTVLGSSLLDYYMTEQGVGSKNRKATEYGCLTGEGWEHAPWSPTKGEIYEVVDGQPIYEGDLDITYHGPHDIIRETSLRHTNFPWLILRTWANKWDLVAKNPELREEILAESSYDYEDSDSFRYQITGGTSDDTESDEIPVYYFYHNKSEAMPEGRMVQYCKSVILFDGPLPYDEMPLINIMPATLHESAFGYSPFADLLSLQQATNNLLSSLLTNNLAFGTQFLWKKKGGDWSIKQVQDGMKMIVSEDKPEALNLTRSAPETYEFLKALEGFKETLSGISSTVRGNPPANVTSGANAALLISQSIQFGSGLEAEYDKLLSKVGTTIIQHLQRFSQTPRLALLAGEANRPFMKEFSADDIASIKRVHVQQTNALSKTISGRLEIANQIMTMPPDKARQYMSILNTGQLPSEWATHGSVMSIKAENEALRNGKPVRALISEHHAEHFKNHLQVLESPEAKEDSDLVARVLEHAQEHLDLWRKADPGLLMITGQQPPPPDNNAATILQQQLGQDVPIQPQIPQQGPGPQGMPQNQMPENMPPMADPMPIQGGEQVRQPNMPRLPEGTDPTTQQAYDKIKGGI